MAITFEHHIKDNTLLIKTQGTDDNLEEVGNYGRQILGLAIKNNCERVLCDERDLEYQLSFTDTYDMAEAASQEAKSLRKIAIVCGKKYLKEGKFYELVSQNRGLNMLVTDDIDQANQWISE